MSAAFDWLTVWAVLRTHLWWSCCCQWHIFFHFVCALIHSGQNYIMSVSSLSFCNKDWQIHTDLSFKLLTHICNICKQTCLLQLMYTSAVLFQNGPIAWPLVLLTAAFLRIAHPNNFTLNTAHPWVLSKTPAKCEVNQRNGCRDNRRADRKMDRDSLLYSKIQLIYNSKCDLKEM